MPVVSRSDCTQTNVKEHYSFYEDSSGSGFSGVLNAIKLQYQACQGANNQNNDLSAFVQQLVNDGKLSTTEQEIFQKSVVGKNNCEAAVESLLEESGFESGHDIDYDDWTFVVGEGFDNETPIYDKELFREMVEAQEVQIVRRACPSCKTSHKDIYYRRLTPMPTDFDLLDTLMHNWFSANNVLNVDFSLHSTYLDAYYGTNGWTFCNYDDPGIGFPRDCGPHERVNFQWNSYTRNGGDANHHAFLIPADPDFVSTYVPPLMPTLQGTDYSFQIGTLSSGTTVTHFDNNDYLIYTSINFGSAGSTKGFLLNYSKGNDGGELEIRLGAGVSGQLISKIGPASTGGWDKFMTAYVGLLSDVSGIHDITLVAKKTNGVLNVGSLKLSDFSERISAVHARIPAVEYSSQSGVRFESPGNVGYFDNNDFVSYSNVNFGSAGTTKGILLNYAKANDGGEVEVRKGGADGQLIAKLSPASTSHWHNNYITAYLELLTDVTGIQEVTFVGKGTSGVLNLMWFELSDFSERSTATYARIPASEFSSQSGVRYETHGNIGYFDTNDYVTYTSVNFGSAGTTNNIKLRYAKANSGGTLEIRSGGPTGTVLATFNPTNTGGWQTYAGAIIPISASGVMDIALVAKNGGGVLNYKWFELMA